ncbi:MAG: hypothetical protein KDB22_00650 [Planctomycetales bacterium]|nr:hypothetical protein [Planctomycetales bacterium]
MAKALAVHRCHTVRKLIRNMQDEPRRSPHLHTHYQRIHRKKADIEPHEV